VSEPDTDEAGLGKDLVSFDIFYQPCRFGTEPVERKNPFTSEVQTVLPVEPLTSQDLKAVQGVVRSVTATGPDEHGCYLVRLGDGSEVEVHAGNGFESGCMTAIREGITPDILRFLFDLLSAADWIMLPAMEGNPAIVALPGRAKGFADGFPEVVCSSVEELGKVLTGGIEAWMPYKDQIVEE
jgi:hypothetical protein